MQDDGRDVARRAVQRHTPKERVFVAGESYTLIGDEERVDREWENDEARVRREAFEEERDSRARQRQAEREKLTLGVRLDRALFEVERHKTTRARALAPSWNTGEGSPGGMAPPQVGGAEVDRAVQLIEHHVRAIEEALDAELGLLTRPPIGDSSGAAGGMVAGRLMSTAERNRIVWDDFQGVRAEQVAREAPYLGTSARTIERARAAEAAARGVRVRLIDGVVIGPREEGRAA